MTKKTKSRKKGFTIKVKQLTSKIQDYRKNKAVELVESGRRLFNLNEKKTALKDLKKALYITPQLSESTKKEQIAYSIALVYRSMKDDKLEIKYYQIAIKNDSSFYKGLFELGKKYLDMGKRKKFTPVLKGRWNKKLTSSERLYKEALYHFKRSIKAESSNPEPYYYAGYTLELLNNPKNAIDMFDKVLNLEKTYHNIEESSLFKRVRNEPKEVKDICSECKEKIRKGDDYCVGCGHKIK